MKFDVQQQAALAIAVLGFGYFLAHTIQKRSDASQSSRPSAQPVGVFPAKDLDFPGFREKVEKVSLSIGTMTAMISLAGLRHKSFKGTAFSIYGQAITPYLEGNHIYVDVKVYRGPGLSAVEVKQGAVTMDVPGWDRNSDKTAFEVVNEKGIPVIQMIHTTPSSIVIRGVLVFANGLVMVANEKGTSMNPPNPLALAPKPIFKYPSRLHPGESSE